MAHEKLKKEMLASIDQCKNFIETEQERLDTYTTTLNTNESKFIVNTRIISLVPASLQFLRRYKMRKKN